MKFGKPEERVNGFVSSRFKAWSEAKERMANDFARSVVSSILEAF